jgi:hypothetical protein
LSLGLVAGCGAKKDSSEANAQDTDNEYMQKDKEPSGVATLGYSKAEHNRILERTVDTDFTELIDDVDLFLMLDRPSRLSKWDVR